MSTPYPPAPSDVPPDLTRPSRTYQRHTWAAVAGLIAFAGLYLGMLYWFGHVGYQLVMTRELGGVLFAAAPLFLCAFLVKGLFFVRKGELGTHLPVTAADEPALLDFVHRIADDVGAPRPHAVFLTPDVNASVFYDQSLRNLVWPSKKNLNLGLGLVNVLTLDELKAVLAHEFGHFAQRTMAVGSWVYIAQQAIGAVVARRDGFDKTLDVISRIDLRIAWVGWLMRLVVWSVRVVLDTAFRGVVVLERALSREMEFQADLVAVSATGSDALIHALRRIGPADDALQRAMGIATGEGRAARPVADLYEVQSLMLEQLRNIWNDPMLGRVPPLPSQDPASHRVFSAAIAEVPRMWATHPPSHEREANAKARYIPSPADPRSAWVVFADAEATRRRMTAKLYADNMEDVARHPVAEPAVTAAKVTEAFARRAFDARYRGVYVGRDVPLAAKDPAALVGPILPESQVSAALDALYPESLGASLKGLREANAELGQLQALADGVLSAPGGVIRFRGRTLRRSELPEALAEAKAGRDTLASTLAAHDRAVRTAHASAAAVVGRGWGHHLRNLLGLLHYTDHVSADLLDANAILNNVFHVVTADGNVSSSELNRLIRAANDLQGALAAIYGDVGKVGLPEPVARKLEVGSWKEVLGEDLKLPVATREGLAGNWLEAAPSWVRAANGALERVSVATLEALLEAEDEVARTFRGDAEATAAPEVTPLPSYYATFDPANPRPRQKKLDVWTRFQTADGFGAGALRFAAAGMVLGPAVYFTGGTATGFGDAEIVAHNGLAMPVIVNIDAVGVRLEPGEDGRLNVPINEVARVSARTEDGRTIESFEADAGSGWHPYVYNIASADVLVREFVGYGVAAPDPEIIGATRWIESREDYTVEEPPNQIRADGGEVRSVLSVYPAIVMVSHVADEVAGGLAVTHLTWDPAGTSALEDWADVGLTHGVDVKAALAAHPEAERRSVPFGRLEQEIDHDAACAEDAARAAAAPDDADAAYLAVRCLPDDQSPAAVAAAAARFPEHAWLQWALSYEQSRAGDYATALTTLGSFEAPAPSLVSARALQRLRLMRILGHDVDAQLAAATEPAWSEAIAVEAGRAVEGDMTLARALYKGDLVAAGAALPAEGAEWGRWMIAGSDGATPEMQVLAQTDRAFVGATGPALWPALAFLANAGADRTEVAKKVPASMLTRLNPVLDAARPDIAAAVDAAVVGADVQVRGLIRYVGILRLGADAPEAWRTEAKALLLPWERGWLR